MKIVSWNLHNIGLSKLKKTFQPLFQSYGMGNNVLDYIVNVVLGADTWEDVVSPFPPDLFIVVELKTGGDDKGGAVSGRCLNVLTEITNAMNAGVTRLRHSKSDYLYGFLTPKITGYHETVGFIANSKTLKPTGIDVERDRISNTYLPKRTPLYATFQLVENPSATLRVSGIHAPAPKGKGDLALREPINWCVRLARTPTAVAGATAFFAGDFNCQPGDTYENGGGKIVGWSDGLTNFTTQLPNNTLSSLRVSLGSADDNTAYLSSAYDNSLFRIASPTTISDEDVPDLIGKAKNVNDAASPNLYPARGVSLLNAYRIVSDHLPVITEFNVQ